MGCHCGYSILLYGVLKETRVMFRNVEDLRMNAFAVCLTRELIVNVQRVRLQCVCARDLEI